MSTSCRSHPSFRNILPHVYVSYVALQDAPVHLRWSSESDGTCIRAAWPRCLRSSLSHSCKSQRAWVPQDTWTRRSLGYSDSCLLNRLLHAHARACKTRKCAGRVRSLMPSAAAFWQQTGDLWGGAGPVGVGKPGVVDPAKVDSGDLWGGAGPVGVGKPGTQIA